MKFYLRTFWQLLKFVFVPSLINQKPAVSGLPAFSIEFKRNGLPLIISFAGLGDQFNFGKTLRELDVNAIYLRDMNHNWYLNGLEGIGNSVDEVKEFLSQKSKEYEAPYVLSLGTSAGGFAALLYGSLLQVDEILAFSPQTFMNRWNCIRYLDHRWLDRVVQIYQGPQSNRAYLDLKQMSYDKMPSVTLVYDKTHRLDRIHANRVNGQAIKHLGQHGGGHTLVHELRNSGFLHNIIKQSLPIE